jgi:hypothetical protein
MDRDNLAKELMNLARGLISADETDDSGFTEKVQSLGQRLEGLDSKKKESLKRFGIGLIRPDATVEDLVDALDKVAGSEQETA